MMRCAYLLDENYFDARDARKREVVSLSQLLSSRPFPGWRSMADWIGRCGHKLGDTS